MLPKLAYVLKGIPSLVGKANPYHDATGAFTSKDKATNAGKKEPADNASNQEWADYLQAKFPKTKFWDMEKMHHGLLKDAVRQYVTLAEKYPWAADHVGILALTTPNDIGTWAFVDKNRVGDGRDFLGLCSETFGDPMLTKGSWYRPRLGENEDGIRAMFRNAVDVGYHPEGTEGMAPLVTHEFGHVIDDVLSSGELSGRNLAKQWGEDKTQLFNRMRYMKPDQSSYLTAPSDYAKKTEGEMFAEAFAQAMHNPYFSDKSLKVSPRDETVTAAVKKMLAYYSEWKTTGVRPTRPKEWLPPAHVPNPQPIDYWMSTIPAKS